MVIICWIVCWIINRRGLNLGHLQERSGWQPSSARRRSGAWIHPRRRSPSAQGRSWAYWGPLVDSSAHVSLSPPFPIGVPGLNWSEDRMMMGTIGRPPSSWTTAESLRNKLTLVHSITFKLLIFLQLFKTFYSLIWTFMGSQSTSRDIDHKCCSWKLKTGTQMHLEGQRFQKNLKFLTFLVLLSNQIHLKSVLLILRCSPFFSSNLGIKSACSHLRHQ